MKLLVAATVGVSALALKNQAKVAKNSKNVLAIAKERGILGKSIRDLPTKKVEAEELKLMDVDTDLTYCELQSFDDNSCSGGYLFVNGVAVNTCITVDGDDDTFVDDDVVQNFQSEMYTIEEDGDTTIYYKTWYSDTDCTDELATFMGAFDVDCNSGSLFVCYDSSNHYDDLGAGLQFNYYESASCSGDPSAYDWVATGTCLGEAKIGCDGSNDVKITFYESNDCGGDSASESGSLPSCSYQDEMYYDDDGKYGINTVHLYSEGSCSSSSSDDDGCFSEFDTVTMKDGSVKAISQVQVGDEVLVMNAAGEYVYSNVVYVPHGKNNNAASFVSLTTESGRSVSGTVGHLMVANDCAKLSKDDLMTIDSIAVGQCVMTVDGAERVTDLKTYSGRGVYTVVTADPNGKIVVNGIAASSFAYNHAVVNTYYHIHRMLTVVVPEVVSSSLFMTFNNMMGKVAANV